MNQMHSLKGDNWQLLNSASIVLLPKKNEAMEAKDYRPVSLMHSAKKKLCKMMANRLAPELHKLVSSGQSAFIKGRSIQDNFLYVRNVVKKAHKTKRPLIFLKLDIAKAFDSLNWGYLLRVLTQMGFGQRWRNIISLLLGSASSRIMLNGKLGAPFSHKRGLRQGDPLSSMLFILAMESLQCLFEQATAQEVLTPIKLRVARLRASFYADDAALFVNPIKNDILAVQQILKLFGDASGLRTSLKKCVAYPVACDGIDLATILQDFSGAQGVFPCRYLGLPLGFRKPRKIDVQPLFDSAVSSLKGWRGILMTKKGRLTLINSVITSIATYFLTIFPAEKWIIKSFNKLWRNVLWTPDEEASRGKCLVSWQKICASTIYGGLGIKDMQAFSRALRLRWEWFRWNDRDQPWVGTETPCDQSDKDLFTACTSISIGNGEIVTFWHDRWLDGQAPKQLAPLCFNLAVRKNLTVKESMMEGRWMHGLQRMSTEAQIDQFVALWGRLRSVALSSATDSITWHISADGRYSASSAYAVQLHGRIRQPHLDCVWRIRAEGNVKFFFWLLLQNRQWTTERLRARGLPHDDCCCLCDQEFETAAHLALNCPFAKEAWSKFQSDHPRAVLMANRSFTLTAWWKKLRRGRTDERLRRDISLSVYVISHI
jgi:mannosylglycoprotein endo-beta-mannosidase